MTDPAHQSPNPPSIQVDSDWKAQAQAERERLAQQESARSARADERDPDALPPAEFRSLVGLLASQAVMGLGTMGDQQGRLIVDLAGSKFAIDLLLVLQEKTKGNLSAEETKELDEVLRELKSRFMQVAKLVTEQMARGQAVPGGTGMPAGASPVLGDPATAPTKISEPKSGGASKLIIP